MKEYRKIKGFERYLVSSDGEVVNSVTGKILSQREATNGYLRVNLRTGNEKYEKPKVRSVHRLVAETFLIPAPGKECVNHIDGNKKNNSVSNLEWCTPKENTEHAIKHGLMSPDYISMNRLSFEASRRSHQTEEYRQKMQQINEEIGITKTVLQIDINNGQTINRFKNCYEAARFLFPMARHKDRLISRCAKEKYKSAYGYVWVYEGGGSTS